MIFRTVLPRLLMILALAAIVAVPAFRGYGRVPAADPPQEREPAPDPPLPPDPDPESVPEPDPAWMAQGGL